MSADYCENVCNNKTKRPTKKYDSAWENYKEFKDWLSPSKKGTRFFYCKKCRCDYDGGIAAVKQHSTSPKHTGQLTRAVKPEAVVLELTEKTFNEVAASCDFLFIMFYFAWDKYLTELYYPVYVEASRMAAEEFQGSLKLGRVEFYDNKRLSSRFNIGCAPLFILYQYKKDPVYYRGMYTVKEMVDFLRTELKILKDNK